jgi:putative OPT family oligopeptide transporter
MGVGYIIGPRLAALNFSGGVLAWGLLAPMIAYFKFGDTPMEGQDWAGTIIQVWRNYVRPIAIGGMLVGAGFTLWRMRKNLIAGISRSISDVKKAAKGETAHVDRIEKDIPFKWILIGIGLTGIATFFIYNYFAQDIFAALVATVVMIIAGFFFAAVSGYLVGIIGSSNNPISGLTLSTLVVAALLMVVLGMSGQTGVAAVLGVAAVVCVSAAVAGEMLQDLKAGHFLGGTPWKMQVGDLFGVALSAAVMFYPLMILHEGDIRAGGTGFGGDALAAPQASLMAILSNGIVAGDMEWILILVGMLMGVGFILMNVKSPMLVSVGMYLPLGTTFAIFVGGLIKGIVERFNAKRKLNDAQKSRVENTGILLAAGLIAGEALVGLLFATIMFFAEKRPNEITSFFSDPSFIVSLIVVAALAYYLISIPLKNAGKPDDPAPPAVSM